MNKYFKLGLAVVSVVALSACHCHHHRVGHHRGYVSAPVVKHHVVQHQGVYHGHYHR